MIECSHPIRSAITVAGIFASTRSHFRISGSTTSTNDPRGARRYTGGASDAKAARTVFLATPSLRTIALIGMPSALCSRRISAQSSTEITLQECRRGVKIQTSPRGGQYSPVVDTTLTALPARISSTTIVSNR